MKRIIFLLILTLMVLFIQIQSVKAATEKVMTLKFDTSSSLIHIGLQSTEEICDKKLTYKRLDNPNRIYFDLDDAILIGEKKHLVFEKSDIKEIKLSQFSTQPDIVRAVITFDENFDSSKVKLFRFENNIFIKTDNLELSNTYFNQIYDEVPLETPYSSIIANSQLQKKIEINQPTPEIKMPTSVMEDIQNAFGDSTFNDLESLGNTTISVDVSSNLKLRTKYYINGYYLKNGGLLVNGIGQISTEKIFYLDDPKRAVIDLPNTFLEKNMRNQEIKLCPDGSCKDVAKIGQFEHNKARIVITSENAEKYIPIYSADAQSLLFINADKLNHTDLVNTVANLGKAYVKKINNKTSEVIFSFTAPVVHSILRDDKTLSMYMFNVKNYNEQDLIKTLNNTYFNKLTMSLLPKIGVRATLGIKKNDIVKIEQSVDGKAIKLTIKQGEKDKNSDSSMEITAKKEFIRNKVVIDAGHGGSDYGAIREGINEKDITLEVAQRVSAILKSKGYPVVLTRLDDSYLSLEERVEFSENETPEIFISIHVNSAVATEPNGIETHYYHEYSKSLANVIHNKMIKNIDAKDRGLFKSKFYVINHTTVPAVLVEMGFLSNPDERAELMTEYRKQKTANAIAEGIIEYLKTTK